jgi:hypothetical protein
VGQAGHGGTSGQKRPHGAAVPASGQHKAGNFQLAYDPIDDTRGPIRF